MAFFVVVSPTCHIAVVPPEGAAAFTPIQLHNNLLFKYISTTTYLL